MRYSSIDGVATAWHVSGHILPVYNFKSSGNPQKFDRQIQNMKLK